MTGIEADAVAAVRRFNRFYTRRIGLLDERQFDSPFSLTEMRVLYELAHRDELSAADLVRDLGLDAGYVSRMLAAFERKGLVERSPSAADGRRALIALTAAGRAAFAPLERYARAAVAALLGGLGPSDRKAVLQAMVAIERTLAGTSAKGESGIDLRRHGPGDMGWVTSRHGALYADEYGWDDTFEALVAEVVAAFLRQFDPARERCWIAVRSGERVGSVFLVRHSDEVAKLRLLLVEPEARGLGLGRRLVEECETFARSAGYRRITLWTNSCLEAARAIYRRAGYRLVHAEPHRSFGKDLVGETWELDL